MCDVIAELPARGVEAVVIVPLGFVSDHMEVLWDLDTEAMDAAQAAGIRAVRTPTPGVDPAFVSGLVDLVDERRDGTPAARSPAPDRARPVVRRVPSGLLRERPRRIQAGRLGGRAMTALFKPGAPIRVGTRASALAVAQTSAVAAQLGAHELVTITSEGDRSTAPLASIGGTGVFVSALRDALLAGEVDLIVHSFKDLPTAPADGIRLAAVPVRADARDALATRDGVHARAGSHPVPASAPGRRGAGRSCWRHGPISRSSASAATSTRVSVASTTPTTTAASTGWCSPRPGWSGSGGSARRPSCSIWRRGRPRPRRVRSRWRSAQTLLPPLAERVATIDDPVTRTAATAERGVLARLEAGCSAPIAAHASVDGGVLWLTATVYAAGWDQRASRSSTRNPSTPAARPSISPTASRRQLLDRGAAALAPLGRCTMNARKDAAMSAFGRAGARHPSPPHARHARRGAGWSRRTGCIPPSWCCRCSSARA